MILPSIKADQQLTTESRHEGIFIIFSVILPSYRSAYNEGTIAHEDKNGNEMVKMPSSLQFCLPVCHLTVSHQLVGLLAYDGKVVSDFAFIGMEGR